MAMTIDELRSVLATLESGWSAEEEEEYGPFGSIPILFGGMPLQHIDGINFWPELGIILASEEK